MSDPILTTSTHIGQFAFLWNERFYDGHIASYSIEKTRVAVEETEPGRRPSCNSLTTSEIIDRILVYKCKRNGRARFQHNDNKFKAFLSGADIENLRNGNVVSHARILMDIRNNGEIAQPTDSSPMLRPLMVHELYAALQNNRHIAYSPGNVQAERKLIFIAGVDSYCVLTLIATASTLHAHTIREFITRSLSFRPFLRVRIPPVGFPSFALELHLPYYSWIQLEQSDVDTTVSSFIDSHNRFMERVMCLDEENNPRTSTALANYIFKTKVSILVVGIDRDSWTGLCLADDDCIQYYADGKLDPYSCGSHVATHPVRDPREFWLRTFESRIQNVKEEWQNSVEYLLAHIAPHKHKILANFSTEGGRNDITQQKSYHWTTGKLREFKTQLTETIIMWHDFCGGARKYFNDETSRLPTKGTFDGYMIAIEIHVTELRYLVGQLQSEIEEIEEMPTNLATQTTVAESRISRYKNDFVRTLTWVTIFYLPIQTASALFSMQTGILPTIIKRSYFTSTLLGLVGITLVLVVGLYHTAELRQGVSKLKTRFWAVNGFATKSLKKWLRNGWRAEVNQKPFGSSDSSASSERGLSDLEANVVTLNDR